MGLGPSTRQAVRVNSTTLMAMFMKEDGPTISSAAMDCSGSQMGPSTEVDGGMASSMVKATRYGPTGLNTSENMFKVRKKGVESTCGTIKQGTSVSGRMTSSTVWESIYGEMEGPTADSGTTGTCMASEGTHSAMADGTKANTFKTRNMDMESTPGPTEESTKATGRTESSMDSVNTLFPRRTAFPRRDTDSGKMAHVSNGSASSNTATSKLNLEKSRNNT